MVTTFTRFASPLGELLLTASDTALTGVYFDTSRLVPPLHVVERGTGGEAVHGVERGTGGEAVLARTRQQLAEYFAGVRTAFDLPLEAAGSAFEHRVWDALRTIPYGVTTSYSELARRLGDPRATRAVGAANGKNPIPIIVPCHRVIGAHGELTGFGGGLDRKRWLLEHEGALMKLGD
jgi:methylated-DNA-[protein]-cysteine S-methyltransferase